MLSVVDRSVHQEGVGDHPLGEHDLVKKAGSINEAEDSFPGDIEA